MNTVLFRAGLLASLTTPSGHSVSNHLSPSGGTDLVFFPPTYRAMSARTRTPQGIASWASPSFRRLATTTGRIEFAGPARRSIATD